MTFPTACSRWRHGCLLCPLMERRVRSRKFFLVTTLCPWVSGCVLLASESRGVVYQQEGSVPYRLHPQKVVAPILGISTPFRHSGHTLGCSSHPGLEHWGCPEPRVTYPFRHPGHLGARCPHLGLVCCTSGSRRWLRVPGTPGGIPGRAAPARPGLPPPARSSAAPG